MNIKKRHIPTLEEIQVIVDESEKTPDLHIQHFDYPSKLYSKYDQHPRWKKPRRHVGWFQQILLDWWPLVILILSFYILLRVVMHMIDNGGM